MKAWRDSRQFHYHLDCHRVSRNGGWDKPERHLAHFHLSAGAVSSDRWQRCAITLSGYSALLQGEYAPAPDTSEAQHDSIRQLGTCPSTGLDLC